MDKSSIAGIALALGGILLGLMLEGGKLTQILQPTAAMIVLGGTMGAVMLQFPLKVVFAAFRRLGYIFVDPSQAPRALIGEIVTYANKTRISSNDSLDAVLETVRNPFLEKAMVLYSD